MQSTWQAAAIAVCEVQANIVQVLPVLYSCGVAVIAVCKV